MPKEKRENKKTESCLVLFCKRPALYQGKQRLAKTIGAAQALIFAWSFLDCALEDVVLWPGPVILSPSSADDIAWAQGLLDRDYQVIAQSEGNIGHRIQTIDHQLRGAGYGRIIFIGSDAPALKTDHYEAAIIAMRQADVLLCPASDGGVAIMGSRVAWPDLRDLPWSTERLGHALETLCRGQGLEVQNISPCYDIDLEEDLMKLQRDLANDPRPARQRLYKQIAEFLTQDDRQYA